MKPRDYCCCAIPVVYAGIYIALLEQFVLGVTAGVLSIATTDIVGASTPSFAKWLFAIICWIAAGVQIFGFVAVRQERPIFYRRYVTLHCLLTVAAFGVGAAWVILSATRHKQAQSKCIADFFGNTISANNSEGQTLCDIFPWVDVGIMGGLWVLFAIVQTYLYVVVSSFGKGQRRDHTRYSSLLNESSKSMTIPLTDRGAWDPRTSMENLVQPSGHARHDSDASVATVMADKPQGYSDYPPHVPGNAYTQEPGPTPRVYDSYYDNYNATGGVGYPERSQAHPGEL
ncbi:hypothetical protein DICSQDRAFT_131301 [Dichomitus squalens LYAD-421 SS1]|uniref:Uncharacterized protein n=1 Tax=Dichomitus squalens TaxID=114155 RepID=A0A4Q9N2Y4_9APHY|nr:uncharacterized protein DICSQDRAFT_131301 [Dichomitus squalens LYAD-421 SS1]EJF67029.1 hypothetical protein DICSQDRAFT_131301 [Dichomitus squalens LYAD-421 SS1]TBU34535.1 hypothetical protein BD311DRAFT_773610 [Dichomitus squalens]TBU62023.1 hypothetical protein BD310DRAFT_811925 [Dichomitus squalens]